MATEENDSYAISVGVGSIVTFFNNGIAQKPQNIRDVAEQMQAELDAGRTCNTSSVPHFNKKIQALEECGISLRR
ncbi:MAG: hypothetical protein H6860_02775 [Rhodospirillales bacterium]|nr:hypothetical protein [Rhodospirillales bacterium]